MCPRTQYGRVYTVLTAGACARDRPRIGISFIYECSCSGDSIPARARPDATGLDDGHHERTRRPARDDDGSRVYDDGARAWRA